MKTKIHLDKEHLVLATAMVPGGHIRASTKTKIGRPLPIIDEIRECFANRIGSNPVVFTTPQGRAYSVKMLSERSVRACKSAYKKYGTPMIGLHKGLKHSLGIQRLAAGYSMEEIKEVFGHTSTATTKRYAKYLPSNLAAVMSGNSRKSSPKNSPENKHLFAAKIHPSSSPSILNYNGNQNDEDLGGKDSNLG